MDKFWDEIIYKVPVLDAIEKYTSERPNRAGFIRCPLHHEKTPSLKVKDTKWHCFGCGNGGNVINFVMEYFDLDFISACKKLDLDYGLKLGLGYTKEDRERQYERQRAMYREKKEQERYNKWKQYYLNKHISHLKEYNDSILEFNKLFYKNPSDPYNPIIKHYDVTINNNTYDMTVPIQNFNSELIDDPEFQYQVCEYIHILKKLDKLQIPSEDQLKFIYNSTRVYKYK